MTSFWLYFKIGLHHVLDMNAYDHILFFTALMIPYVFKDWKRILILVSLFTIGHTLSLMLSVYNIISVSSSWVEFLIPVTILITAVFHLFTAGKKNQGETIVSILTLFFGTIHGLGFSNYFKTILPGSASGKLLPLLEFALGIEAAQIIVVIIILILAYIVQTFFRFSRKDWALVLSAFVIGVVTPMLLESDIWNKKL